MQTGTSKSPEEYKINDVSTDILLCISSIPDIKISSLSDEEYEEVWFTVTLCVPAAIDGQAVLGNRGIPTLFWEKCLFFMKSKYISYQTAFFVILIQNNSFLHVSLNIFPCIHNVEQNILLFIIIGRMSRPSAAGQEWIL